MSNKVSGIDLFCGVGGLTHGLMKSGINMKAGFDNDESCCFAYESNNRAVFHCTDISSLHGTDLLKKYWNDDSEIRILVGCAPCQPFSSHTNKIKGEMSPKWNLLNSFLRLTAETEPHIVSMENVPNLAKQEIFKSFVEKLEELGYNVSFSNVFCPDYGIPQKRRRLVLLASKFGDICLIPKTHSPKHYKTTADIIKKLPRINGGDVHRSDMLHCTMKLSDLNLTRIQSSKPNGTWRDWDENLRLECHKKSSGKSYVSVYGRMSWDEPSPTITTQFYNYGTGRFGHPEQDRALTFREAALLQTFPKYYRFVKRKQDITIKRLGVHIGNAVPVKLGKIIGKSILSHLKDHNLV